MLSNLQSHTEISSQHYDFYFPQNSIALRDLKGVMDYQEKCFEDICRTIGIESGLRINYIFFNDSAECGRSFDIQAAPENVVPINAFCYFPNTVHAVYNESIKCIGCHEVAHLLLNEKYGIGINYFLNEGFAVYSDQYWSGLDIDKWAALASRRNSADVSRFISDQDYFLENSMLSYPFAGAFTRWMIREYGIKKYLEILPDPDYMKNIDAEMMKFTAYLSGVNLSEEDEKAIMLLLEENV